MPLDRNSGPSPKYSAGELSRRQSAGYKMAGDVLDYSKSFESSQRINKILRDTDTGESPKGPRAPVSPIKKG